jgi:rhodanese-related sulfurtransferase
VVIESLSSNGVLTWTNSTLHGLCRVEWAPSLQAPWRSSWEELCDIPVTNLLTERPVPMFYRVVSYEPEAQLITNVSVTTAFAYITNRLGDPKFIVLDVRTPGEYSTGHVKTALNVNFNSSAFQQTLQKLDRNRTYFLYCASGGRSAQATEVLRNLGFMEVLNLTGGGYSLIAAQPGAGAYLE